MTWIRTMNFFVSRPGCCRSSLAGALNMWVQMTLKLLLQCGAAASVLLLLVFFADCDTGGEQAPLCCMHWCDLLCLQMTI